MPSIEPVQNKSGKRRLTSILGHVSISKRSLGIAGATAALFVTAVGGTLFFLPVSWAKHIAEGRLRAQFGVPATIGSLQRESGPGFSPVILVRDIHVPQPAWVGQGALATIGTVRLRLHALPLLLGRLSAEPLSIQDASIHLVRSAEGNVNWQRPGGGRGGRRPPSLAGLTVSNTVVQYDDARQLRHFTLHVALAPATGLRVHGTGQVDGAPVQVGITSAKATDGAAWPFKAVIDGPRLGIVAEGAMQRPLELDAMRFKVRARADDLQRLDRIVEAGLFGTQPVTIVASVAHSRTEWNLTSFDGRVGDSPFKGRLSVLKDQGRTKLDGQVRFSRLNFDDLASDAGQAAAAVLERKLGPLLVPNTRINIRKIKKTDGQIDLRVDQVTGGKRPSSLKTLSGHLALDDRILHVSALRVGLEKGDIVGQVIVKQRDDRPKPVVTIDLSLENSSVAALAGAKTGGISGDVKGRVHLEGIGDTIREAVGASTGEIGLVARSGSLPENVAALIGFDLGKGLLGSKEKTTAMRCAVVGLAVNRGRGAIRTLVVDTDISQSVGSGTITFPAEALDLSVRGQPKGKALLRYDRPVRIGGTIRAPKVVTPPDMKSAGSILGVIGRSLGTSPTATASDADCETLSGHALASWR